MASFVPPSTLTANDALPHDESPSSLSLPKGRTHPFISPADDAAVLEGPESPAAPVILPLTFQPFSLGSISPTGWLRAELQAHAEGLAGHEYEFYDYVKRSPWLGGDREYALLNEGFPYWFNGLVHLAYGLNDSRLKAQVHAAANYVLTHQQEDGWIGPEELPYRSFWGRYPLFLGLSGLAEANSSWIWTITDSMHKFVVLMNTMLRNGGSGYQWNTVDELEPKDFDWGRIRSADMVISLIWLLENDPREREALLVDNMHMLYDMGIKWEDWYNEAVYRGAEAHRVSHEDVIHSQFYFFQHGVNVAQGLKAAAVYQRLTHNESLIKTAHDGVNWTFTFHGAASGTIIADDVIDEPWPYAGAELCTTVEAIFSLIVLYQTLGDNNFADRVERAAFNALPGMVTPDWWAHQYMTQANQPYSRELTQSPFFNTDEMGQTFGLEPNFPCCTLNHPQGLPKFLAASYVKVGDKGIAHALLGPTKLKTLIQGEEVNIDCKTEYPFSDRLHYYVEANKAFDFFVRIPGWALATDTTVTFAGESITTPADPTTGLLQIAIPAGVSEVDVVFDPSITIEHRANDTISVIRGALLYALEIRAHETAEVPKAYKKSNETLPDNYAPEQSKDYTMTNTTAWNLAIDPSTLYFHRRESSQLPNPIFAPGAPPVWMTVKACEIEWPLFRDSVPDVPIPLAQRSCLGDVRNVVLRPFGSTKLHMADLPTIKLDS